MKRFIFTSLLFLAALAMARPAHAQNINTNQVNWAARTGCGTATYLWAPADQQCEAPGAGSCPGGWVCITSTATDLGTQENAAVTTLGAGGGVIWIGPGAYTQAVAVSITQNNISIIGAGGNAVQIACTVSGDCLSYQMTGSAVNLPSVQLMGWSLSGNGTSGQIPLHLKDFRGGYLDVALDDGGSASPCLEFENVAEWTESNSGSVAFGANCYAAVEMYQDNETNHSFGYNYLRFYVQVGNGQIGLYIPTGGATATMYNGSLTFTGDLSGTGVLIDNQGMNIGGDSGALVPTTINVQTERAGGTIWSVSTSYQTIFVSPSGINTASASQGTAFSIANKFYPYNSQASGVVYLPNLASTNQLGTDVNGKIIAGTPPVFQHNGTNNSSQSTLNLVAGTNVTITDGGGGAVTIAASGGGGGGGAWTNITGSSQVTASGCTQSGGTGGSCAVSGSSTSAVTLSVIPGTYTQLHFLVWGQTSATENVEVTLNSDTSSDYGQQGIYQSGNSNPSGNSAESASLCIVGTMTNGVSGSILLDLPFYSNTTFEKSGLATSTGFGDLTNWSLNNFESVSCGWNQTSAITSVTFTIPAGNFVAGTSFALWGIS